MVNYKLIRQEDIIKYQDECWLENHIISSLEFYFQDKELDNMWEYIECYDSDFGGESLYVPDITMPKDVDLCFEVIEYNNEHLILEYMAQLVHYEEIYGVLRFDEEAKVYRKYKIDKCGCISSEKQSPINAFIGR